MHFCQRATAAKTTKSMKSPIWEYSLTACLALIINTTSIIGADWSPYYGSLGEPELLRQTELIQVSHNEFNGQNVLAFECPSSHNAVLIVDGGVRSKNRASNPAYYVSFDGRTPTNTVFFVKSPLLVNPATSIRWVDNKSIIITSSPYELRTLPKRSYAILVVLDLVERRPRISSIR